MNIVMISVDIIMSVMMEMDSLMDLKVMKFQFGHRLFRLPMFMML